MDELSRPIFIVAPPQSGTLFLSEALDRSPDIRRLGRRGRAALERAEDLAPSARGYDSNRRTADDATPEVAGRLRTELRRLISRRVDHPSSETEPRIVDATARHALRVPFLDAVFPDASFVYVYREPREAVASMVEAWESGDYVTYPRLPEWPGLPWSMLLVPEWHELVGRPLAEIATEQWLRTVRILLDDLETLPPERWCVADYAALASDPATEIERICHFLGIDWDGSGILGDPARHVAQPSRKTLATYSEDLQAALPRTIGVAERARDLLAAPVSARPMATPDLASPLRSLYTGSVSRILAELGSSVLLAAPKNDTVTCIRRDGPRVNTHFRAFGRPTAITTNGDRIAVATRAEVHVYLDRTGAPGQVDLPERNDALFLPTERRYTGDLGVLDLAYAGDELWLVSSRFSCLATLDGKHSFVPRWRPPFVTELAPDDRCHLSGLAMVDGHPGFVTALGTGDEPDGWRAGSRDGGCVLDVESREIVAAGLSLPHSPRWHDGRLWLLESGEGTLCRLDPASGDKDEVIRLPGFTRGLAFAGSLAFVGLSRLREGTDAEALGISEHFEETFCGLWIVDAERGRQLGYLRFQEEIAEIFSVDLLTGRQFPEIADPKGERARSSFALPH